MTTKAITPLRQRMIEDINARKLCAGTQRDHIRSCKRFAAFLKRPPDTATLEDTRRFQLYLAEAGLSIGTRNQTMTGLRFLFRVTLRRLDLANDTYHLREPVKIPQVMSPDETRRLLAVVGSLKVRVLLSLGYGCGLRAGEAVRLTAREYELLEYLMRNERIVISRQRLLDEVWGYDPFSMTNTIEVFVSNLRRKLEAGGEPRLLHTIRGAGYVLRV